MARRPSPPWLIQPIAHRGLHDRPAGIIENTVSAFRAAIEAGFAIETDIQAAAGQEPVVFHDATLQRLTHASGAVCALSPQALKRVAFKETGDGIVSLSEFLDMVAERVPVFLEIKTAANASRELERKIATRLAGYGGPAAIMSFDPGCVRAMRTFAPGLPRGMVSMRYKRQDWPGLSPGRRFRLTHLLDFAAIRPDFLAYHVDDLPLPAVTLLRRLGVPVLAWTVRGQAQQSKARAYADAMIFEELRP